MTATAPAPAISSAAAAVVLREILCGQRPLQPVDRRRLWSMTAFGPVAVQAGDWRCVFQADDAALDRVEAVTAADGRETRWTDWLAAGEANPVELLDVGEQHELESRLHECR